MEAVDRQHALGRTWATVEGIERAHRAGAAADAFLQSAAWLTVLEASERDDFLRAVTAEVARHRDDPHEGSLATVLFAWAHAIDRLHGQDFESAMRLRADADGVYDIQPGRAVLRPRFDLKKAGGQAPLSANPDTTRLPGDRVAHLVLAPREPPPLPMKARLMPPHAFDALEGGIRLALARPARSFVEDLEYTPTAPGPPTGFHEVRPKRPAEMRARSLAILEAALDAEAQVILFPELVLTAEIGLALEAAWRARAPVGSVLVAGTLHRIRDDRRVNDAIVCFQAEREAFHQTKQNPYGLAFNGENFLEDIDRGDEPVWLHQTGRAGLVVLVCKDALEPTLIPYLGRLGITLCLVPALSPATRPFNNTLGQLVAASQTISAVVATPVEGIGEWGVILEPRPSSVRSWPSGSREDLWVHRF